MAGKSIAILVLATFSFSCPPPIPYPGRVVLMPTASVAVTDSGGNPVAGFDLTMYRCTNPGSQFDRTFQFPNRSAPVVKIKELSGIRMKKWGGTFLAPDFYVSYEPQPYWVACVAKAGYASRRWGLPSYEAKDVTVVMHEAADPGPDSCPVDPGKLPCTPCRSFEYFMYETMRIRHEACANEK